jgi:hypothetical protein
MATMGIEWGSISISLAMISAAILISSRQSGPGIELNSNCKKALTRSRISAMSIATLSPVDAFELRFKLLPTRQTK